jgi:hypothetical protein
LRIWDFGNKVKDFYFLQNIAIDTLKSNIRIGGTKVYVLFLNKFAVAATLAVAMLSWATARVAATAKMLMK